MKAVVDTSPLFFLSKLDYLLLLKTIFQKIHVPMAVFRELSAKKDEVYRDTEMLIEESFMVVEEVEKKLSVFSSLQIQTFGVAQKSKERFVLNFGIRIWILFVFWCL